MLTDRTDRAWFSRLLRHPARKWSGSILTILELARGDDDDDDDDDEEEEFYLP